VCLSAIKQPSSNRYWFGFVMESYTGSSRR
jgi:hypothetical protein